MLHIFYKKTKSCRGTHSRKRRGRNYCCKGKAFIWIVQGFWKKSAEMEAIFNRCWVLKGHGDKGHGDRYIGSLFRGDEPVPDDLNLKTFIT